MTAYDAPWLDFWRPQSNVCFCGLIAVVCINKNKIESTLLFSELSVLNKAMNLGFFELLGDAGIINEEANMYHRISREEVRDMAIKIFTPENCCELYYKVSGLVKTG